MAELKYDVVGIGNAIVDVLAFTDEAFLTEQALKKGAMTLIEEERAEALYRMLGPATECSGGSVANTLAGIASLGGEAAFIGKVRNDQLGAIFRHDMRAVGVAFDTPAATFGPATARCLICVTPDAQRTMNTFIGACAEVAPEDIDGAVIGQGKITYIEGYLWDPPAAKEAIRKALRVAREAGRKLAFSLSDVFCVERHREEFLELLHEIDLVFANEAELKALFDTEDFEGALREIQKRCPLAAVTRSEQGSVIVTPAGFEAVPAEEVSEIVDSTGAGDLYAAGFLYGITQGWSLRASAELGTRCAARIIAQVGARSQHPLNALVAA